MSGRKRVFKGGVSGGKVSEGEFLKGLSAAKAVELRRLLNKFDGAGPSPRRGRVTFPFGKDGKKEVPVRSRKELARKSRWGEANIGLVGRCTQGSTAMVGYLTPQPDSGEGDAFDEACLREFERRCYHPTAFDVCGKLDFFSWQLAGTNARIRDGDALTVLGKNEAGGGRIAFYESNQVDSGKGTADSFKGRAGYGELWDGVYLAKNGRHVGYSVVTSDDDAGMAVDAVDAIFHCEWSRSARVRGVSKLAHAISNVVDIVEILADTKHGIKIAALWGVVQEVNAGASGEDMAGELKAFFDSVEVGDSSQGGESAEGDESAGDDGLDFDALLSDNIQQGGRIQAVDGSLKTIADERPHPNKLDLLRWLVRDIAWGLGVSPDILWDLSGIGSVGVRYLMADTRRWITGQQRILERDCQRIYTYMISCGIQAGRIPKPKGDRWFRCVWQPQADMTVDVGREGALAIKQLEVGLTTYKREYGKLGLDSEKELAQWMKERKERGMDGV